MIKDILDYFPDRLTKSKEAIFITTVLGGLTVSLVLWRATRSNKKTKNTVPTGPPEVPLIGGSYEFTKAVLSGRTHELFARYPKFYGNIYRISTLFHIIQVVHIVDADAARRVITDNSTFRKSDLFEELSVGILDFSLFLLSSSDLHKKHRKLIQPAFAPSHLRQVPGATSKMLKDLSVIIDSEIEKGGGSSNFLIDDLMMDITLDVLGLIAFGRPFGAIATIGEDRSENVWLNLDSLTLKPFSKRLIIPSFLWYTFGIAPSSPSIKKSQDKMAAFFRKLAEESKDKLAARKDEDDHKNQLNVLERLLLSHRNGLLSEKEIFGEMLGFFLAGHETSSHTISFTIFELAKNPEIQQRLYDEIKDFDLESDDIWEQLTNLKFLESCVKESQRLHTVVNAVSRENIVDTEILGFHVPAKTWMTINIRGIHMSPLYYKDPETYNPDRWFDETLNPNAFIPFGLGSHQCIGMKMAIIEIKVLLIGLLQRYSFSFDSDHEPLKLSTRITFKAENLRIRFQKRNAF